MKKLKNWLICRVLPLWAREELLSRIQGLEAENSRMKAEILRLNAYIGGLETGIRNQRRVIIYNGEKGK